MAVHGHGHFSLPYDCHAGLANWHTGWSAGKKAAKLLACWAELGLDVCRVGAAPISSWAAAVEAAACFEDLGVSDGNSTSSRT